MKLRTLSLALFLSVLMSPAFSDELGVGEPSTATTSTSQTSAPVEDNTGDDELGVGMRTYAYWWYLLLIRF